ncbi:pyridoxal-phosphate dependent enzyme [Acuticoccus mangrovi]|uniref:pyridoxal-phosphate dependent enzyme n=1 Tax=Acuticoccus mangrovi TaxID=2796142 RepID=UPI002FC65F8D
MVNPFDLPNDVVDEAVYRRAVDHLRTHGVVLPRFAELVSPVAVDPSVDPDAADPRNLFRVHWYNDPATVAGRMVPAHVELPKALTGVDARILVMLGENFPIIHAHKVLAAYACLAPRLASGAFDPAHQRAVWPSTGNYCRGGVAISRILGCRGIAVLPEGMSAERFRWLEEWVTDPADIIRTYGSESNVKEIYDACAELERQPDTMIFNQFSEFPNYLGHYEVTGQAAGALFEAYREENADLKLAAFVAATGSAGTLAAGDRLKEDYDAKIAVMEPIECPTLLYNGFGEHNIQGIGDKHVPLIHNVTNTDIAVGVSDEGTDDLYLLFNSGAGRQYLAERRKVDQATIKGIAGFGLSGIGNMLAAIKVAKRLKLGPDDVIVTVATDSAALYESERDDRLKTRFGGSFDMVDAGEAFGRHILGGDSDHLVEMMTRDRDRMFNLGYYTWVEQQGISVEDFERRRPQSFWRGLREKLPGFDALIDKINHDTGLKRAA